MIVFDTNVVSELMKSPPEPTVVAWMSGLMADDLFTTTVTVAEVLYGIDILPKSRRHDLLQRRAEDTFGEDFGGRVLSFDERAAHEYAHIASDRRRRGRPIPFADAQIAAIARVHGATLATRDTADFEGCGVKLFNPWKT
jgi:predicted nucleic acid-binding protein